LVEDFKPPKVSSSKKAPSISSEASNDQSSPKDAKTKSVLSVLVSPFRGKNKRKTSDRSPEVPKPSKKPSLRSLSPSTSSFNQPSVASVPAQTPSLLSVNSFESDIGKNFEVERLRLKLNASIEDLAIERKRSAQFEQLQAEEFASRSRAYEARIRELENANKGEGSSRRRK
jgi:hypothetical protein